MTVETIQISKYSCLENKLHQPSIKMMVLCILCTVNTWLGLEVYNQHKDPTTIYRHLVHAGLQVDLMFV